jgi:hypothetical protein
MSSSLQLIFFFLGWLLYKNNQSPVNFPSFRLPIAPTSINCLHTATMSSLIGLDGTQLLKPLVALAGWTFVQEVN